MINLKNKIIFLTLLCLIFLTSNIFATDYIWNSSNSSGEWTEFANWLDSSDNSPATDYPKETTDTVQFSSEVTVTLNTSITISSINISDTFTISGTGSLTVSDFSSTSMGGKTLTINNAITASSSLTLTGTSTSSRLIIAGTGSFDIASAQSSGNYLAVSGVTITSNTYTAFNSIPNTVKPSGWILVRGASLSEAQWTGETSTDWDIASNWDIAQVPTSATTVTIPDSSTATTQPTIVNYDVTIASLTVSSGATLSINEKQLTVTSSFTQNGTISTVGGTTNSAVLSITPNFSLGEITGSGCLSVVGTSTVNVSAAVSITGDFLVSATSIALNANITSGSGTIEFQSPATIANSAIVFSVASDKTVIFGNTLQNSSGTKTFEVAGGSLVCSGTVGTNSSKLGLVTVAKNATLTIFYGSLSCVDVSASEFLSGSLTASGDASLESFNGTNFQVDGIATITGNLTVSGTLTANSGTVKIAGTTGSSVSVASGNFYNLSLTQGSSAHSVTVDSGITVSNKLLIEANHTLVATGNTVTLQGAFENNGTVSGGTLVFNFANDSTTTAWGTINCSIEIKASDASKTLTMGGDLTLANGSDLVLTAGTLNINGKSLSLGATLEITSGNTVNVSGGTITYETSLTGVGITVSGGTLNATGASTLTLGTGDLAITNASGVATFGTGTTSVAKLTVSAGTLTAGSATVTASGIVTITSGIANFDSATVNANGGLSVTGGTFNIASGTIKTNGAAVNIGVDFTLSSPSTTLPKIATDNTTGQAGKITITGAIKGTTTNTTTNTNSLVLSAEGQTSATNGNIVLAALGTSELSLGTVNVSNVKDLTVTGAVYSNNFTQVSGAGTTKFESIVKNNSSLSLETVTVQMCPATIPSNVAVSAVSSINIEADLEIYGGTSTDATLYLSSKSVVIAGAVSCNADSSTDSVSLRIYSSGTDSSADSSTTIQLKGSVNIKNLLVETTGSFGLAKDATYNFSSGATIKADSYFYMPKESSITCGTDGFLRTAYSPLTSCDKNILFGEIQTEGILTMDGETFFASNTLTTTTVLKAGSSNKIIFDNDVHFICAGRTIQFNSPIQVNNLVLYGGTLDFSSCTGTGSHLITNEDLVLLNGNPAPRAMNFDSESQVNDLYSYADRPKNKALRAKPNAIVLADTGVWQAIVGVSSTYSGEVSGLAGKTIQVGKNFYSNGVDLLGDSEWTIKLPNNDNATNSFAEVYNASIKNCNVELNTDVDTTGTPWIAASENCTDSTGNVNVDFKRPYFKKTTTATVYDDVVHVEFVDIPYSSQTDDSPGTGKLIENSNNEISKAVSKIKYYNGTDYVSFLASYIDAECTTSTDGAGDISVFYVRTSTNGLGTHWNTDATGSSSGGTSSTDRGRLGVVPATRTARPSINVVKAAGLTDELYETLRDSHKNRIAHYSTGGGSTAQDVYTQTLDQCSPVIVAVKTGQEIHSFDESSQHNYDGHNFIEIQYSEPVNIGDLTTAGCDNKKASLSFASTAEHGGAIVPSVSGLEIKGFIKTTAGSLVTATRDNATDNEVHSLYRTFAIDGESTPEAQPERVRISIAGYKNGTKTIGSKTMLFWEGFIESGETPSGVVEVLTNNFVLDLSGNYVKSTTDETYDRYAVSVDSTISDVYGPWDLTPPCLAGLLAATEAWTTPTSYEVLPIQNESGRIAQFEMHFLDNALTYTDSDVYRWRSKNNWFTSSGVALDIASTLSGNPKVAASPEFFGGSRPTETTATTYGGIRDSSLFDARSYMYFSDNSGTKKYPVNISSGFVTTVNSNFMTSSVSELGRSDDPYITAKLDTSVPADMWSIVTTVSVSYEDGFITDVAGNRMKNFTDRPCLERTQPRLIFSLAGVDRNDLFLMFSKKIEFEEDSYQGIELKLSDGTKITPTSVAPIADNPYGLLFKFNQNLEAFDVIGDNSSDAISMVVKGTILDPYTGASDVDITYFHDLADNYVPTNEIHKVSDLGIGLVDVLYGADGINEDGLYNADTTNANSGALRVFDGTGRLLDRDLTIATRINLPDGETASKSLVLYFDGNVEDTYRADLFTVVTDGLTRDLWLPTTLAAFVGTPNSQARNEGVRTTLNSEKTLQNFMIPESDDEMLAGTQMEMVFSYGGLFCARLENEQDITSVAPWSFGIADIKQQRGGVTILNNVIDSLKGEKAVLQVEIPKSGSLLIQVFTLDGNLVKLIERTKVGAGIYNYSWDGTNGAGDPVARGLYFVRVTGPKVDEIRKVMVIKE